jgi:DNA invertase Pin-like site-specific DNA recombinase
MTSQEIGHIRMSSVDQNAERQLDGIYLDKVFTNKASGKDTNTTELQAALNHVRLGDTLIVHSMPGWPATSRICSGLSER